MKETRSSIWSFAKLKRRCEREPHESCLLFHLASLTWSRWEPLIVLFQKKTKKIVLPLKWAIGCIAFKRDSSRLDVITRNESERMRCITCSACTACDRDRGQRKWSPECVCWQNLTAISHLSTKWWQRAQTQHITKQQVQCPFLRALRQRLPK